jgi:chaperonin GroEL
MQQGVNISEFISGINKAINILCKNLKDSAIECSSLEQLQNVATISCNGDSNLGFLIADAIIKVGKYGLIECRESKTNNLNVEFTAGYSWDKGISDAAFLTSNNGMELNDVLVCVTDDYLSWGKDLLPLIDSVNKSGINKPFVIIAPEIKGECAAMLINSAQKKVAFIPFINPEGYASKMQFCLEDIASLTGATIISPSKGINWHTADIKLLGKADKIFSNHKETRIICSDSESKVKRIEYLEELQKSSNEEEIRDLCVKSLAKLTGGVAIVNIKAQNESEYEEIKDRIEDAVGACRSAQEMGIVAGGGVALLKADFKISNLIGDEILGVNLIKSMQSKPIEKILSNADKKADYVINKIINKEANSYKIDGSIDSKTMIELNVIDPVKVIVCGLKNAASVACLMLRTSVLIVSSDE